MGRRFRSPNRRNILPGRYPLLAQFTDRHGFVLPLGEEQHVASELALFVDLSARRYRPVMPSNSAKGSTISAGAMLTSQTRLLRRGGVDELKGLVVDERFNDVVDGLSDEGPHFVVVPALVTFSTDSRILFNFSSFGRIA